MEQFTLHHPTDTAHPQASVPIYLIHSREQPFCKQSDCWCQTNKACVVSLLTAIQTGTITMHAAAIFADGKAKEG